MTKSKTGVLQQCRMRMAGAADAGVLSSLAFRSKASWGYDIEFMKRCREELTCSVTQIEAPQFKVHVCDIEDSAVAFYSLELLDDERAELDALFVRPEFIGHGIGKMMVAHMLSEASALGIKVVSIQGDPNAEDFYRAIGAVPNGYRESVSIPGRYLPVFTLSISQDS